jgi:hypothetical protein
LATWCLSQKGYRKGNSLNEVKNGAQNGAFVSITIIDLYIGS